MNIRDIRNQARGHLHEAMHVEAIHVDALAVETPCKIRVHDRTKPFGSIDGLPFQPVERVEYTPQVVVLASEIDPSRGDTFSLSATEAYRVETALPPDGITITCEVVRLREAEAALLTNPATYVPPVIP